jgi:hypothetical protein
MAVFLLSMRVVLFVLGTPNCITSKHYSLISVCEHHHFIKCRVNILHFILNSVAVTRQEGIFSYLNSTAAILTYIRPSYGVRYTTSQHTRFIFFPECNCPSGTTTMRNRFVRVWRVQHDTFTHFLQTQRSQSGAQELTSSSAGPEFISRPRAAVLFEDFMVSSAPQSSCSYST